MRLAGDERVLVRAPNWLGDFVMAVPALRALARRCPRLSVCAPAPLLELLGAPGEAGRHLALARGERESAGSWRGHDVALLLTGSFRSAWTAFLAGIPDRVGWSRDGRAWLLTAGARPPLERGRTPLGVGLRGGGRRFLPRSFAAAAAELAGLIGAEVRDPRPRVELAPRWLEEARSRLGRHGIGEGDPFVLFNVGARPGSAKGYPPGLWAGAIGALAGEGAAAVLVGGPGEEDAVSATHEALGSTRAVVLGDRTEPAPGLGELAALSSLARVVATADSGPRHLAAAVGAPVVCVLGPTDARHGSFPLERTALLRNDVPCGPCHRERCPLAGERYHVCMRGVEPGRVADAVRKLLGEGAADRMPDLRERAGGDRR